MNHKLRSTILLLGALLLSGCISASFTGDYVLRSGQTLQGNLFATSGSVTLEEDSRVTGWIVLTSGELHIGKNAQVGEDVVLTSGAMSLADGAVVHGDVILSNTDIAVHQDAGSRVEGNFTYNVAFFVIALVTKTLLLYCVLPVVLLIAVVLGLGVRLGKVSKKGVQDIPATASALTEATQQKLEQLKGMLDKDLITGTDYETKKADILSKM